MASDSNTPLYRWLGWRVYIAVLAKETSNFGKNSKQKIPTSYVGNDEISGSQSVTEGN